MTIIISILKPSDRRLFSPNAIDGVRLSLMRGDRFVDLAIGDIEYNYDKRMIINGNRNTKRTNR